MAITVYDLAVVLDTISGRDLGESFTLDMTGSWADISVATLDPTTWKFPEEFIKPIPEATEQIVREH